jgi:hypothetical protein
LAAPTTNNKAIAAARRGEDLNISFSVTSGNQLTEQSGTRKDEETPGILPYSQLTAIALTNQNYSLRRLSVQQSWCRPKTKLLISQSINDQLPFSWRFRDVNYAPKSPKFHQTHRLGQGFTE